MGCDIHLYVEKYNKAKGEWEFVKPPKGWDDFAEKNGYTPNWYQGRNYNLFAILADVRNGRGFAGVDTGDRLDVIAQPKGTPKNASGEYKAIVEDWGIDGHSHSFFTLQEVLDFPGWEKGGVHRGWVSVDSFEQWRSFGKPSSWSGGVSGQNVKHISNDEMADLADRKLSGDRDQYYNYFTKVEWSEGYKESCKFFVHSLVPKLAELAGPDLSLVRINFFFDN